MWCLILLGLCGRFQVSSSEIENVCLYESMPSFMWEDTCTIIVDACIADGGLFVMHREQPYSEYSGIRCYEPHSGEIRWEIDSLKAECFPVCATLDDGMLYVCVHHPDSTDAETVQYGRRYNFSDRLEDSCSSPYLLQCYEINSGQLISEFVTGCSPAMAPPVIADNRAVILSPTGLLCFSLENGERIWQVKLSNSPWSYVGDFRYTRNTAGLVHDHGVLYVALKGALRLHSSTQWRNIFALSLDNGDVLWSALENRVYSGPVVHDGGLYYYSYNTVAKHSIHNGEVIWERSYGDSLHTNLWQQPQLTILHYDGHPFIYADENILIPRSGSSFSDSVDVLRLSDGVVEASFSVSQMERGMNLLEGNGDERFLLSSETIDRRLPHLTLRSFPDMERHWMYYFAAYRFVAGEGYICALKANSFMVLH